MLMGNAKGAEIMSPASCHASITALLVSTDDYSRYNVPHVANLLTTVSCDLTLCVRRDKTRQRNVSNTHPTKHEHIKHQVSQQTL